MPVKRALCLCIVVQKMDSKDDFDKSNNDTSERARHLRKVHLTLILSCLGILATSLLNRSKQVEKAYNDIRDIITIARGWKENWLQNYAQEFLNKNNLLAHIDTFSFNRT